KQREKTREEFRASFNALGRKAANMDDPSKKELLRITMALREANKISQHLKKNITFSRDEVTVDGKTVTKVRLNDTKKGLTTLWTLEKFESRLDLMRDM
ncbi:Kinesin-like protein KIF14, partial [Exaiptasia diaphana]